ncbi:hypothetical protein F4826_004745 [Rahnella inusitata]|nr:hypothetical protein [Rahnella inusitata]
MIHLITTCSKSKTTSSGNTVFPYSIGDIDIAMSAWRTLVLKPCQELVTSQLYLGMHWSRAIEVALRHKKQVELWVLSAGLGLRHVTDPSVPYEATFSSMSFSASDIWQKLTESPPLPGRFTSLLHLMLTHPDDTYVVAGSPVYLNAVEADLMAGTAMLKNASQQLQIVTSKA